MLFDLKLHGVGPAAKLELSPVAPRLNVITGDNGLGKSFLLDVAWWALTRTWHGVPAVPTSPKAAIEFAFDGTTTSKLHRSSCKWEPKKQAWKRAQGRPPNPGLVIYARVDGSYSVWDPARNYRLYQRDDGGESKSPESYQFSSEQVLEGLRREVDEGRRREQVLCQGLVDDWTRWQASRDPRFRILQKLLAKLGPEDQPLEPGVPMQPTLDDDRLIPTIRMPYAQDVPIVYAPAGVQRMCKLAYLLAWSLAAHKEESRRIGQPSSKQIIVLIDEPETHLHPRWQRTVLPSLLDAITNWDAWGQTPTVQFIVATHSPLVLVSLEPLFDPEIDALWKLDLDGRKVVISKDDWHKRGNAERWLLSDVFDLRSTAARRTEQLLQRAGELLDAERPKPSEVRKVDAELTDALPDMDPFFVRWRYHMKGVLEGRKR